MSFESFPSIKKEQGPDKERVREFVVPITDFVEGKREAIEILRTNVKRNSKGEIRPEDREALKSAVAQVREGLRKRYEPTVVESPNARRGLEEKITQLEKIEDQLAFAA